MGFILQLHRIIMVLFVCAVSASCAVMYQGNTDIDCSREPEFALKTATKEDVFRVLGPAHTISHRAADNLTVLSYTNIRGASVAAPLFVFTAGKSKTNGCRIDVMVNFEGVVVDYHFTQMLEALVH